MKNYIDLTRNRVYKKLRFLGRIAEIKEAIKGLELEIREQSGGEAHSGDFLISTYLDQAATMVEVVSSVLVDVEDRLNSAYSIENLRNGGSHAEAKF